MTAAEESLRKTRLPEKDGIAVAASTFVAGQLGVIATRVYRKGEVIFSVEGPVLDAPTRYSFAVGRDRHIEPLRDDGVSDFGHYLNHACDPNVIVRPVYGEGAPRIDVVARHDIQSGEELAFDYATLEYEVTAARSPCQCGTARCRSVIHGFKDLPAEARERYAEEGMVAAYLLDLAQGQA